MTKKGYLAMAWSKVSAFAMMLVIMLSGAVMFTSCGEDDEEGKNIPSSILGTWTGRGGSGGNTTISITFNSDGTGSFTMTRPSAYGRCEFTYKCSGNTVTTTGPYVITYTDGEVQNNKYFKVVWTNHGSYLTSELNTSISKYYKN